MTKPARFHRAHPHLLDWRYRHGAIETIETIATSSIQLANAMIVSAHSLLHSALPPTLPFRN